MNTPATVEVNVVFDGSKRRPGGRVRRTRSPASRRLGFLALTIGVLNLLIASGLYYGTWWKADPYIFMTFMMRTPTGLQWSSIPLQMAAQPPRGGIPAHALGVLPATNTPIDGLFPVRSAEPDRAGSEVAKPADGSHADSSDAWSTATMQVVIGVAGYGWLTVATVAACFLGLAGGALLGATCLADARRAMRLLFWSVVLANAIGLAYVLSQYGTFYKPTHLRVGMGGLVLLCMAIGTRLERRSQGLTNLAAIALILSAAGSALGLYLWGRCDAIEPE
ncbi:MAG: hypothetical protein IID35_12685, partial [Planctomycetes bacterium]|nr:hypothetical protein [Planctomycetota bacterium]